MVDGSPVLVVVDVLPGIVVDSAVAPTSSVVVLISAVLLF